MPMTIQIQTSEKQTDLRPVAHSEILICTTSLSSIFSGPIVGEEMRENLPVLPSDGVSAAES